MQNVLVPVINKEIPSGVSTQNFACPRLPALRVELEMDRRSFESVEPFLRLTPLQGMAQKLLDSLKRDLQWTVEQYDYSLRSLDVTDQVAARPRFNEALQRRCLALRDRCEKTICEIARKTLKDAGRRMPKCRGERELVAAQSTQTFREWPVERPPVIRT